MDWLVGGRVRLGQPEWCDHHGEEDRERVSVQGEDQALPPQLWVRGGCAVSTLRDELISQVCRVPHIQGCLRKIQDTQLNLNFR